MCGIVGIYLKTKKFEKNLGKMLSGMLNNMESRGPDSAGFAIYKNSEKKEYKYSLCINNLDFNKFKKNISKKIKNLKLIQYSDHVIVKTTEIPKKFIKFINKEFPKISIECPYPTIETSGNSSLISLINFFGISVVFTIT